MKVGPKLSGREPDILYVARKRASRLKKNHLDGPADLAVEISNQESRKRDRVDKFYEYQKGGVREYWLIDEDARTAEFYQLGKDGKYRQAHPENGIYRSAVLPGLWIRVDWLFQEPLPPALEVLREWEFV